MISAWKRLSVWKTDFITLITLLTMQPAFQLKPIAKGRSVSPWQVESNIIQYTPVQPPTTSPHGGAELSRDHWDCREHLRTLRPDCDRTGGPLESSHPVTQFAHNTRSSSDDGCSLVRSVLLLEMSGALRVDRSLTNEKGKAYVQKTDSIRGLVSLRADLFSINCWWGIIGSNSRT